MSRTLCEVLHLQKRLAFLKLLLLVAAASCIAGLSFLSHLPMFLPFFDLP